MLQTCGTPCWNLNKYRFNISCRQRRLGSNKKRKVRPKNGTQTPELGPETLKCLDVAIGSQQVLHLPTLFENLFSNQLPPRTQTQMSRCRPVVCLQIIATSGSKCAADYGEFHEDNVWIQSKVRGPSPSLLRRHR